MLLTSCILSVKILVPSVIIFSSLIEHDCLEQGNVIDLTNKICLTLVGEIRGALLPDVGLHLTLVTPRADPLAILATPLHLRGMLCR